MPFFIMRVSERRMVRVEGLKQKGLTEYFRAGVKSHKSTCQELYKKDR